MQARGVSRWPKKFLHTESKCSNQSIHYSCCTSSESLVGWQLTSPCTSRAMGMLTYKSEPGPSAEDISGGTERWSPQHLSMSSQLLQNGVNLLPYHRKAAICHNSSRFSMAQWSILLSVTKICILLSVPVNLTSFASLYMRILLKTTKKNAILLSLFTFLVLFLCFIFAR